MSEIQVLVENIRTSIAFPQTVPLEQMQIYSRRYAEFCAELNHRLLLCVQHVRAGNVAEGIRLAELRPNLSEMYFALDFAEQEEWTEVVSMLGFDIPQPLPVDMVRELDDAYLKMAPLDPLLRRHRFLALSDAPIRERLDVLRVITKTDRGSIFWEEDQETFERIRLKELEKEVSQAINSKNDLQVRMLYRELSSPDWILPPPPGFRKSLVAYILQSHADLLMKRFAAFDFDGVVNFHNTIQQILSTEQMTMPPGVGYLIRPAVQWIEETVQKHNLETKFNLAVSNLQNALEKEAPLPNLQRLYYVLETVATQAGTVVPEKLEELYHAELTRHYSSARMRNWIIVAVFATVSLFLLIGLCVVARVTWVITR
jgi:hypothetical protein